MTSSEKKEIENQIEKLKKDFQDYLKIIHKMGVEQRVIDKRTDIFLDDLSRLLKELEKCF